MLRIYFSVFPFAGFPKFYIFMAGGHSKGGADRGGQIWRGKKIVAGGTLAHRNQISVFVCTIHTFHKNVCFTVCLNSTGCCDSAMVNVGC